MHPPARPASQPAFSRPGFAFLIYLFFTGLVLFSVNNGFFWDNILVGSRYANWYYSTNFQHLFLPSEIDAGYQPLFGMLLALSWKIFGRNLWVSHLVMLPFVLGIVHQALSICRKYIPENLLPFAALLVLADPTLMAQCTQVSPDVVLVFLYLFCLNQMFRNRKIRLAVGLIFLGMISLRGTISVAALFFTAVWMETASPNRLTFRALLRIILIFLPAVLVACGWLLLHYLQTGWLGYNPDPNWNWSTGAQFAGLKGMLRNIAVIGWRLIDFGRLGIWLAGIISAYLLFRKRQLFTLEVRQLAGLFFMPFLFYSLVSIPYTNTIGHRYYAVVYLLFALFVFYLITRLSNHLFFRFAYCFMLLLLASGHFWVYPDPISKGWDSTLAHLPYFRLKKEMSAYILEKQIPFSEIGTDFPNLYPAAVSDLNNDNRAFKEKNLKTDRYIFYSNVFNGFTDEELLELKTDWKPLKRLEKGQVYMMLYQRPD